MMTYHLLFVVLMILLGPAFLVRGDDDGQDQLSIAVPTSNPQLGPDSVKHNSSYDPSKNLSLDLGIMPGDDCTTASDCGFIGAICSDKDKKCKCSYGQSDISFQGGAYKYTKKSCRGDFPRGFAFWN